MARRPDKARSRAAPWLGLLALAAALGLASCSDDNGSHGSGLSKVWQYDTSDLEKVDAKLIAYDEAAAVETGFKEARAVAVGPGDRICAGGDEAVRFFDKTGSPEAEIKLDGQPRCLAVAPDGAIYVGVRQQAGDRATDRVEVIGPDGVRRAAWESFGPRSRLTSIALGADRVYVADAGERLVWECSPSGQVLRRIGAKTSEADEEGFDIPSPYFDVAVDRQGVIWAANTGRRRVEAYSPEDGCRGFTWGKSSAAIDGFFGCCNPAHFAIAPDGRFVTSEKGLLRVKVYSPQGEFESVVAPPGAFAKKAAALDVAVDSAGRALVLDPVARKVRIFVRRATKG